MNRTWRAVHRFGAAFAKAALSAMAWFGLLTIGGFGLIVAGVYTLAGFGWALLASGVALLLFAAFVMKGLANG